jgi:hypothetical protein
MRPGRNGLGSIYVFSGGNGGENGDNCNNDGFVNSIYTIAINAIDQNGDIPDYVEPCASIIVGLNFIIKGLLLSFWVFCPSLLLFIFLKCHLWIFFIFIILLII